MKPITTGLAGTIVHALFMYFKTRTGLLPSFQPYQSFQSALSHWVGTNVPAIVPWAITFLNGMAILGFLFGRIKRLLPGKSGAGITDNNQQDMGRSRGGLTTRFTRWWTPMACRSISPSRRVKRMTIGCVRLSSAPCFRKRCCSRIADTTRTGSGSLRAKREHGRTFRQNGTARNQSALALTCIARAT